jgi:hypothetical protein
MIMTQNSQPSNVQYISEIKTFMINGKPIKENELSILERNKYLKNAKHGTLLAGSNSKSKQQILI